MHFLARCSDIQTQILPITVLTHATPGKFDSMTVDTRCSLKLLVA
jgi:hypothetical protein